MSSGRGRGDRQAQLRGFRDTAVMPKPDCSNHLLLDTHYPPMPSYPPRAGMSRPGNEHPRGGTRASGDRRAPSSALLLTRGGEGGGAGRSRAARGKLSTRSVDDGFVLVDLSSAHTRTFAWFRSSVGAARNTPARVRSMVAGIVDCQGTNCRVVRAVSALGRASGQSTGQGVSSLSGVRVRIAGGATLCRQAAGGKSELHRAGCRVTPGRRLVTATESATESRPPMASARGLRQG